MCAPLTNSLGSEDQMKGAPVKIGPYDWASLSVNRLVLLSGFQNIQYIQYDKFGPWFARHANLIIDSAKRVLSQNIGWGSKARLT